MTSETVWPREIYRVLMQACAGPLKGMTTAPEVKTADALEDATAFAERRDRYTRVADGNGALNCAATTKKGNLG